MLGLILITSTVRLEVIGPGAVSYAGKGVLERVAERRIRNGWGLTQVNNAILVAPADCDYLGSQGWLVTEDDVYNVTVVDCEADVHSGQMRQRGLLVDTNRLDLVHKKAWLVIVK